MLDKYNKMLDATYGGDNDYFLLENGNILEVTNDDLSWEDFKNFDDTHGIADDFDDLFDHIDKEQYEDVYEVISKRAIDNFLKENEGKFYVKNVTYPFGDVNVWELYEKETDKCLVSENISTDEESAYRDIMAVYFAQEVATTSESRCALGYYNGHSEFKLLLQYCEEKEIDISDVLAYREIHSNIDRNSSAIAFADLIHAENAGYVKPSELLDGAVNELQAYLDGEVYRATEYTIDGEEVDSCGGFIGDDIENNGIDGNFGKAVEKLGSYENLEACLEDHQEKLGIEIEPVKPLQNRIKRSGLEH